MMETFSCPQCNKTFSKLDDLNDHVLEAHNEEPMKIKKEDFTQVDSHWVCAAGNIIFGLKQDADGNFKLYIMGTFEPIPAATAYPTEPEWETALEVANLIAPIVEVADRRHH